MLLKVVIGWLVLMAGVRSEPATNGAGGLVFLNLGNTLLTGDQWRIAVEIYISEIHLLAAELRGHTIELEREGSRGTGGAILAGLPEYELQTLLEMEEELLEASQALLNLLPRNPTKRGLVNLGGRALKFLFGTADDEDVRRIDNQLAELRSQTGALIHLQEAHLTVTRKLSQKVGANQRKLLQLASSLKIASAKFQRSLAALEAEVTNVTIGLQAYMRYSTVLRNLELVTLRSLMEISRLHAAIESTTVNWFSSELLPPRELSEILSRVKNSLSTGLQLATGTGVADVYPYYASASAHAFAGREIITFLIDIPLQSAGRHYDLYRVEELPITDPNTSLVVRTRRETKYFAVNKEQEFYAFISEEGFRECRGSHPRVCPANFPIYSRTKNTCTSAVFFGEYAVVMQLCSRTILASPLRPVWIYDPSAPKWIYTVPQETKLIIQCPQNIREQQLQVTGEILEEEECTYRTTTYRLLSKSRGHTTVKSHFSRTPSTPVRTPLLRLEESHVLPSTLEEENLGQLTEEGMLEYGDFGADEAAIDALIRYARRVEREEQNSTVWLGSSLGGLLLVSLAVAVVAVFVYWRRRKRSRQSSGATPAQMAEGNPRQKKPFVVYLAGGSSKSEHEGV